MANDWPQKRTAELVIMWADGLSTAEIGRRLGVTKNSVVGKVNRMHLTPRKSPIRRQPSHTWPQP